MSNLFQLYHKNMLYAALLAVFSCFIPSVQAQVYEGKKLVNVQLMVSSKQWAQPFYLAVYFKIAPEWHLYWKNAGDSGLSPSFDVQLPACFKVGDVLFPTPHILNNEGSINYVYSDELLLLLPIYPLAGADTLQNFKASVVADWLVCREKCLRGTDTLFIDNSLIDQDALAMMQKRISPQLIALPKPLNDLGIGIKKTRFKKMSNNNAVLELTLSEKLPDGELDFLPENIENYTIIFDKINIKKRCIVQIPIVPQGNNLQAPSQVRGLLVYKKIGYILLTKL